MTEARRICDIVHDVPGEKRLMFFCPGCEHGHAVTSPRWTWNGSYEKPTFSPSILTGYGQDASGNFNYSGDRCHSFVTDGRIQFLPDCHHSLKGQTIDLPDMDNIIGYRQEDLS